MVLWFLPRRVRCKPTEQCGVGDSLCILAAVLSFLVFLPGCDIPGQGDILLDEGQKHLVKGDWRTARQSFEKALTAYKNDNHGLGEARALGNLGYTYLPASDYTKALSYTESAFNILSKSDMSSPSMLFSYAMTLNNKGALLSDLGALNEAEQLILTARQAFDDLWRRIKWNPFSRVDGISAGHLKNLILDNLATTYRRKGDVSSGVAGLLQVFQGGLVEDRDMARIGLALTSLQAGKLNESREYLEKADRFGDQPENQTIQRVLTPRFRMLQALVLLESGLQEEALTTLGKIDHDAISPEYQALFHYVKGETFLTIGSNIKALEEYKTAKALLEDVLERIPEEMRSRFLETTILGIRRVDVFEGASRKLKRP